MTPIDLVRLTVLRDRTGSPDVVVGLIDGPVAVILSAKRASALPRFVQVVHLLSAVEARSVAAAYEKNCRAPLRRQARSENPAFLRSGLQARSALLLGDALPSHQLAPRRI